jgi:carboxyl-terminal processing protease
MRNKKLAGIIIALSLLIGLSSFKSDYFEIAKQIEIFTSVYKKVNMNYVEEVDPAGLMNTAIDAMMKDLDPYTQFYDEQQVEDAKISRGSGLNSLGASIFNQDGKMIFSKIYQHMPSDKAGIKIGDEIIEINGVSTIGNQQNTIDLLKGAPGTAVDLKVKRQGDIKNVKIKREQIKIPAVPYSSITAGDIGYIKLDKFTRTASKEVMEAVKTLKEKGAKKIILDLRGNPGGLLSEAVNVANIFIPEDVTITFTKSVVKDYNDSYQTKNEPLDTEIPLAVLINGKSASASEIVSGSIQDLDRGVILGERSFGKGLVQRPMKLSYGTSTKITISRYHTPSGRCIQALTYKDGRSVRNDTSKYTAFQTKNGRTVYDSGGIKPDIVTVNQAKNNKYINALKDDFLIDQYATDFAYRQKEIDSLDFKLSSSDYNEFEQFVSSSDFSFETKTRKAFNVMKKASQNEFSDDINKEIKRLNESIKKQTSNLISDQKNWIKEYLEKEIIRRFYYEKGVYKYALYNEKTIVKAVDILNDKEAYQSILNP